MNDFNEEGQLRKRLIDAATKNEIEHINRIKENLNIITAKTKKLVGAFNHNEGLVRRLKEKQIQLRFENKVKLVQDMPVRWCALFNSLDSVFTNKDALKSLTLDPENTSMKAHVPDDNEFMKIDDYCNLLVPIKDLTTILGAVNIVLQLFCFRQFTI